jgi:hypothetical protein
VADINRADIKLYVDPGELSRHGPLYDGLVADLESRGITVSLGQQQQSRSGVADPKTLFDVTVYIGQAAEHILSVAAFIALIQRHLRGKRPRMTQGHLYLPNGDRHEFEVPIET